MWSLSDPVFRVFVVVCDLNAKAFWWDGPDKVIWPSVSAIFVLLTCTCMCIVCMRWSIFRDIVHWYYTVMQSQPSSTCCNNSFICMLDIYKSFFPVYMCITVRKVFFTQVLTCTCTYQNQQKFHPFWQWHQYINPLTFT